MISIITERAWANIFNKQRIRDASKDVKRQYRKDMSPMDKWKLASTMRAANMRARIVDGREKNSVVKK